MNNHSEVSWGDVLQDDNLVWLPHALCRYSYELGLTFDDIGFIAQLFSFRGPEGIHPSDSTLAKRGGFKTRNAIIDRYQRLEKMGYVVREKTRISGRFSSCRYNFALLREKLEELVKHDWASGIRKPKHRVDGHQLGERQHDGHQLDECQQKKLKVVETQDLSNLNGIETEVIPIINDINNTPGPFADFSKKQKNHDIERKIKFSTFRKQLKGDKLQAFELVADNLEKVIGKTLLEFVEQSPETVRSAYEEMVQRDKKHFSYFTKVFFSHLTKQKSPQMRKGDKPARKEMSVEEEADMLAFLEKEDMLTDDILSIYSEKGKELYYAKRNGNGN